MTIATADLSDLIEYFLHSCWLVDIYLTSEDPITQTQLTLTVVSKSI